MNRGEEDEEREVDLAELEGITLTLRAIRGQLLASLARLEAEEATLQAKIDEAARLSL